MEVGIVIDKNKNHFIEYNLLLLLLQWDNQEELEVLFLKDYRDILM